MIYVNPILKEEKLHNVYLDENSYNKVLMNKISEIVDAKIADGGEGAFYIFLKKNKITK